MNTRCFCGHYLDTADEERGGMCDSCHRDDLDFAKWEAEQDRLDAAVRSEVEGSECPFCGALTMAPDGLCSYCRDSWGMSERPLRTMSVPGRDPNWGQW